MLYAVLSNTAILGCFIPFLLLVLKRTRQVTTYRIIGIFWLLNGLVSLPDLRMFHFAAGWHWLHGLSLLYTMAETPLVLLAFACAASGIHRRGLIILMILFIAGELSLVGWKGYDLSTSLWIMGSGLVLVLGYSIAGLVQYLRQMEHSRLENSMAFIYAAFLFYYGSFLIIYIFTHIHTGGSNGADSFLLYHISLLLSVTITSTGLWSYGRRPRRLLRPVPGPRRYSSSSS